MWKTLAMVVGGSGYLGLHLLHSVTTLVDNPYEIAFTYHSHRPPPTLFDTNVPLHAFKVDLQSGEGLDSISATLGQVGKPSLIYILIDNFSLTCSHRKHVMLVCTVLLMDRG